MGPTPAEQRPRLQGTVACVQNCRLRVAPPPGSSFLLHFSRKLSLWPESTISALPGDPFLRFRLGFLQLQCAALSELYCALEAGPQTVPFFFHAWEEGGWVHVCLTARAKGIYSVFLGIEPFLGIGWPPHSNMG